MFTKLSVDTLPPLTIAAGRLTIGAMAISLLLIPLKAKLPTTLKGWLSCALAGVVGTSIPFSLISWGVQYVDSAVAAICMSIIPLTTLLLAHKMTHDEKISPQKIIGILLGTIGVSVLFYSTAHVTNERTVYIALGALLFSAFSYALSGGLIKRIDHKDTVGTTCAILICAAAVLWPIALIWEKPWHSSPDDIALYSVLFLGIFATGISTILLVRLINIAGMTFTSYNTYFVPLIGIALGYFWLEEAINKATGLSVGLILIGLFISEYKLNKRRTS